MLVVSSSGSGLLLVDRLNNAIVTMYSSALDCPRRRLARVCVCVKEASLRLARSRTNTNRVSSFHFFSLLYHAQARERHNNYAKGDIFRIQVNSDVSYTFIVLRVCKRGAMRLHCDCVVKT